MSGIVLPLAMTHAGELGVVVGVLVFIVLFFKLIGGFIKFCFRHPILFILLLICGGLGLAFNVLLGGVVILAILAGGGIAMFFGNFN